MSAPERGTRGTWEYLAFWDGDRIALAATQAELISNDQAAARFIEAERDGGLHYAGASGLWHIWDGHAHPPDHRGAINEVTIGFSIRLQQMLDFAKGRVLSEVDSRLAPDAAETVRAKARVDAWAPWLAAEKYAAGLRKHAGLTALTGYLERTCCCPDEDMAERPSTAGLLNFRDSTLDLATLIPRKQARPDRITYALPARFDPKAKCPRFVQMARRMMGGDEEVLWYFIKCLGYSLLGDNREQKIFFIAGPTGSGKSQVLHIIGEVLGPLAHASQSDLICVVRHGRNARTENSIRGKRFVTITETSQFMSIDEAQLKRLTGEPVISVNQHYARFELPTPVTWAIWVATNQMPTLTNFDEAMRRRIIVFPAGAGVPEWEMDTQLARKILGSETEGVLALLARGCQEYFRSGLDMPFAVREMTEHYALEQNTVRSFTCDTLATGGWTPGMTGIPQHDVWQMYQLWSAGSTKLGRNEFYNHLAGQPGVHWNKTSRRFEGVAWTADWAMRVRLLASSLPQPLQSKLTT